MGIGIRFNLSERVQNEIFASLNEFLPTLPSFYLLQRLAAERTNVGYKEYPICRNECSTSDIAYGDLTPAQKQTKACPVCHLNYVQTHAKLHHSATSNKDLSQVCHGKGMTLAMRLMHRA